MGSPVSCVTLLSVLLYLHSVQTQELKDQDVLCSDNSCLVIYLQRKIFLNAWRSCKNQGGNLVTIKSPEEADMVKALFSKMDLKEGGSVFVWIGLQRQPRKCSNSRPMRGFSWITGEQDTEYTNWEQADSQNACSVPRCAGIGYSTAPHKRQNNFKWKDGPCSVPVDGYLCRYTFPGMCYAIANEGFGNTLYTTPFHLVSSFLTHIPFGSVATVPCLSGGEQTVLCTQREDETVDWNRDPPFCTDAPKTSWCDKDNGGCHHHCVNAGKHFFCDCNEGYLLAEDGVTCFQIDPCQDSPCEFECLAVMGSYRCACPEGYMLSPDEQGCLDVDECLQSPCEQICVNAPGSFECRCRDGFVLEEEGTCEDVDECAQSPCEHACENVYGSHICHCHLGFAVLPEDRTRCYDIDECRFEATCDQMCINYSGGFECYCEEGYELQIDNYSCRLYSEVQQSSTVTESSLLTTHLPTHITKSQSTVKHMPEDTESLYWVTEPSNVEMIPTDLMWLPKATEEVSETAPPTERYPNIKNIELDDLDSHSVVEATTSTTSTVQGDYYEDESTTEFTVVPTTTVAGGAWKWLWFSTTPEELKQEETTQNPTVTPEEYNSYYIDISNDINDYELSTYSQELQTNTEFPTTVQDEKDGNSNEQTQSNSWLLVGLLVPICIFIVVMVALGIVYCTQCASKPQNKNATECYHWIAGAGDKAAADVTSGGVTKV